MYTLMKLKGTGSPHCTCLRMSTGSLCVQSIMTVCVMMAILREQYIYTGNVVLKSMFTSLYCFWWFSR